VRTLAFSLAGDLERAGQELLNNLVLNRHASA
jgi:hypothetical protein